MRWERLFADLELQLDAAADDELDAQVADRTRRELAATSFEGRIRGAGGSVIEVFVSGAGAMSGEVRRVGPGWLLLDIEGGPPAVVVTRCVVGARDLPVAAREVGHDHVAAADAGLTQVLRVLARDRTATTVVLADGTTFTGTIDRVGIDYLDLADHPLDEPRRASAVRGIRTVPLAAVAVLRPRLA